MTWGRSPKWGPMVPWAETSGCLTVHGRRVVMIRHLAVDSWKVALPFRPSSLPYLHPLTHPIPYPLYGMPDSHTCKASPNRGSVAPWLRHPVPLASWQSPAGALEREPCDPSRGSHLSQTRPAAPTWSTITLVWPM